MKDDRKEELRDEDEYQANIKSEGPFGHIYGKKKKGINLDHVPLYRSYGVFRRDGLPRKIIEMFYKIIATLVLAILGLAAALTVISAIRYAPTLISASIVVIILVLLLYGSLRLILKRLKFMRRLKRYCKKSGYTLTVNRRFPKNLFHSEEIEDFSIDTGRKIFYCCFLTVRKHYSYVTFLSEKRIRITTRINAERNKFYQIYDIKQKRVEKEFAFPYIPTVQLGRKKTVKVVVLNPSPHSIFIADKNGRDIQTGTGEHIFDSYYIHTGSGFLNMLDRELS